MSGLYVDLFCGGGGASTGIEAATGRAVDIAINHSPVAIAVHEANHAGTQHFTTDVFEVDPIKATRGKPVELLWGSPDCTHFSRAKGSSPDRPRSRKIRSLAWVIVRWARTVRPRVILMENVVEFLTWGPLDKNGQPVARRIGRTFREWCRQLERLGYVVEWKELDASRYGAPTKRKRLFIVARCDGEPIVWPAPTHGPGLLPFRTAGECIDWTVPSRSIFRRKKPLAQKTLKRIAEGIRRFVLENPRPFIVPVNHGGGEDRCHDSAAPLPTSTASRRSHAVVAPTLVKYFGTTKHGQPADDPLHTLTAKARFGLAIPYLVNTRNGERRGQTPRVRDLFDPAPTVTAKGSQGALAQVAFVAKHYGGVYGQTPDKPLGTVTARDHNGPVVASLVKFRGQCNGASMDEPMPTITSQGMHLAECRAFLEEHLSARRKKATPLFDDGTPADIVVLDGVPHIIVDIFLRMLEPHELLRAQFGEFADGYDLSAAKTKEAKTRLIGNSVAPHVAAALVRANVTERALAEAAS